MARGESPYRDGLYSSPRQRSSPLRRDSPARSPAEHDLDQLMGNLNLHGAQLKKIWIHERCIFNDSLDAREKIKAETDKRMIHEALLSKQAVQDEATATLKAHFEAEAEERRRRLEEERRRQQEEDRRKAEAERQAQEEEARKERERTEREEAAQRAEADRRRQEEEKQRKAAEDAERKENERKQQEAAEQARKDAEAEAARKKKDDEEKAKAAVPPPSAPPAAQPRAAPSASTAATPTASQANVEQRHREYVALHRKLKQFRKDFWEQCKSNKAFKGQVGDMRRQIKTNVGQLRLDGPQENKVAMAKVKAAITQSLADTFSPQVPVNDYLPGHAQVPSPSPSVPSLTIYLLSILSKAVIAVSITTCHDSTRAAEAPGLLIAQLFSMATLQFENPATAPHPSSLVSILLAKFHVAAPQLFGISAPEKPPIQSNMLRLGWRREHGDNSGEKSFVGDQAHYDRLVGLGALWAAISLRNFSKTSALNPIPPTQFWESLSLIINTPGPDLQVGQLVLLKHMLENSLDRIIQFWGATGVALLREAVVGVHSRLSGNVKTHSAAVGLVVLKEKWAKERFHLD